MTYRKKVTALLAAIAALTLIYILGIVFEPERRGSRAASFAWMNPRAAARINAVTIQSAGETIALSFNNGSWHVSRNGKEYPAKQFRVTDFIDTFSRRAPYPAASGSASSHERFGLDDASASRVTFSGGAGPALLDVLVGQADMTGKNVYMRQYGQDEVRLGEDVFTSYISGAPSAWYMLRLIPETEDGSLDVDQVQRLSVYASSAAGSSAADMVFSRSGGEWNLNGAETAELDMPKIESYIRGVLNAEGDDFADSVSADAPVLNDSRIVIELGSGEIKSIRVSAPDENKRRVVSVSGSDLVYSLPEWTAARLFQEREFFMKSETP